MLILNFDLSYFKFGQGTNQNLFSVLGRCSKMIWNDFPNIGPRLNFDKLLEIVLGIVPELGFSQFPKLSIINSSDFSSSN